MKRFLLVLQILLFSVSAYAQLYEGFENTSGPEALPSTNWPLSSGNWTVFNNPYSTPTRWEINSAVTTPPQVYSGLNAAYCNRSTSFPNGTVENYLVTPLVTIPTNGILRFQTRTFLSGTQGTRYQIMIAPPTADPTFSGNYALLVEWDDSNLVGNYDTYEEKIVNLPSFLFGQEVYVAFVMIQDPIATPFGDRWFIDNVSILPDLDCSISNQCPQSINIIAFLDDNNNGVKDNNEVGYPNGAVVYQINDGGSNSIYSYTFNPTGSYYIYVDNPSDSYDLSFVPNYNYNCNTTYNNIMVTPGSGVNTYYFPVVANNPFKDATIHISPLQNPKPASLYKNTIIYRNNGTQTITNGTISFTKDSNLTIVNISEAGAISTIDGFTYDFTDLNPFETRQINVYLQVPPIPSVQLGDLLTNSVSVSIANDINLTNNNASITQSVVGSFDPNDKMESHGRNIVFDEFTANDYLTYTIRFENKGNANAEFIRIEDALDSQLDENTFELLSASHEVNVRRDASQLTFHFYNIDLPPSIPDTETGYGYVQFKIKPNPGYAIGDIIPNFASIYFDTNPPIITNTFNTEFVASLGTSTFIEPTFIVSPNPASQSIQVVLNNDNSGIDQIMIHDLVGKLVKTAQISGANSTTLDVSSLSKGIYMITIETSDNNKAVKKLIIE